MQRRDLLKFLITLPKKKWNTSFISWVNSATFLLFYLSLLFFPNSDHFFTPQKCAKQLTPPVKYKLQFPIKNWSILQSNDKLNSRQPANYRDQYSGLKFQPADFNFPKKHILANQKPMLLGKRIAVHFSPSDFRNFTGWTIMSKAILCCVSFVCNKMQKSNLRAAWSKELCFVAKGFSKWKKRRWRDSRSIKCECHKKSNWLWKCMRNIHAVM